MAIASPLCLFFLFFVLFLTSVQARQRREHRSHNHQRQDKSDNFHVLYRWHTVKYNLPSEVNVQKLTKLGLNNRENIYISNIKIYNDTLYLAMPRLKNGVMATLGSLPLYAEDSKIHTDVPIEPFPNYRLNSEPNCDGFKSVHSFEIDPNGIMWVIDNGDANVRHHRSNSATFCLPSLKLIDLNNDYNYTIYEFPTEVIGFNYYLKDIVVDDFDGGYAYITDNSKVNPGIVVYSRRENRSWKFTDYDTMHADKIETITRNLDLSDNINGIGLGIRFNLSDKLSDRYVFYTSLCTFNLYAVRASWLRNESLANGPFQSIMVGIKQDFSDGMIMDEDGYLYYGALLNRSIIRWDSKKNFSDGYEVFAYDKRIFFWIERFAFDERNNMYALITRFGEYAGNRGIDVNKLNYRIIRMNVSARSYFYERPSEESDSTSGGNLSQDLWLLKFTSAILCLIVYLGFLQMAS